MTKGTPRPSSAPAIPPIGPRDHIRGAVDAPVTLLEYGDFECPQCGHAYPIIKEVHEFFGDRLRVAFRNFPLTNVHPHAQRAAEAVEWASSFDAFWPMHDALFEQQSKLQDDHILDIAKGLGLTPSSLLDAWNAHTFFPRVKEDFLGGLRGGVKGTPAFFVNDVLVGGASDIASLIRTIHEAINEAIEQAEAVGVSDRAAAPPDPALLAPDARLPR